MIPFLSPRCRGFHLEICPLEHEHVSRLCLSCVQTLSQALEENLNKEFTRPDVMCHRYVPTQNENFRSGNFLEAMTACEITMESLSIDEVIEEIKARTRYHVDIIEPITDRIVAKFGDAYRLGIVTLFQAIGLRPALIEGNNRTQCSLTFMHMLDFVDEEWFSPHLRLLLRCHEAMKTDQHPTVFVQPTLQLIRGRLLPFTNQELTCILGRQRNLQDNASWETHPLSRLLDDVSERLGRAHTGLFSLHRRRWGMKAPAAPVCQVPPGRNMRRRESCFETRFKTWGLGCSRTSLGR